MRRKHLKTGFTARSLENLLMPRQSYGVDFYGVPSGEILVIVDLCTRETVLVHTTSRDQSKVAKALLTHIIFARGVPVSLRSDSAPELVSGWVTDINAYLNITQVKTGGYNPRGNAICERANQTIGAMLRKCSDEQYKNIADYLPAMAFAMNCTHSDALNCTPFEAGHGLPARTIAQARADTSRLQFSEGGNDDCVQDISKRFNKSLEKSILELATRMASAAHQEAEWQRRLTSKRLNQTGKITKDEHLAIGAKVWFYKPPDQNQVISTGRKVKHLAHYHGPAVITETVGNSSYRFSYGGKTFQRERGMLVPYKHMPANRYALAEDDTTERKPRLRLHHASFPFREGEFILTKDDMNAPDWYLAEVCEVLPDRIKVNYYTTVTPPLDEHSTQTVAAKAARLAETSFLRTWCLRVDNRKPTTVAPTRPHSLNNDVYSGLIPITEVHQHVLVRDVQLNAHGVLNTNSIRVAVQVNLPHHQGAGGDDDFL